MKQKNGRLRIFGIFLAAIFVIGYQASAVFGQTADITQAAPQTVPYQMEASKPDPVKNKEEKGETGEEKTTKDKEENAEPAATDGSVKGRVISRYISPYSASVSFDGVYLKNNTDLAVDLNALLNEPLSFSVKKDGAPQVLILHTHTTESYLPSDSEPYSEAYTSRSRDPQKNMISVGKIVAKKLNDAGIKTVHDTTEHDYPQYTGSYSKAAQTISGYLKKYPGISVVLDLHRDAIASGESDKVKLVTEIEGKKAAQVMLVMGSQSGGVTNFPNWKENLKLAVRLQRVMEKKYPTLARPISLVSKLYNENLTTGSLLMEFGTDANSLSEAHTAAEMVGDCLVSLFSNP